MHRFHGTLLATLLLAQFDAPEQLRALGGSLFAPMDGEQPSLGSALSNGLARKVAERPTHA